MGKLVTEHPTRNLLLGTHLLAVLSLVFTSFAVSAASARMECSLETTIISAAKAAINNPDARVNRDKYTKTELAETVLVASDKTRLNGLVWRAENARGYVLVVQGTSMLAAEIYEQFQDLRTLGLDVYIYDFRGYERPATAATTLHGILSDYSEIVKSLTDNPRYQSGFLIGLSFGGVVLTHLLNSSRLSYTALVLDSTPHAVPWYYGCPAELDPVMNLPSRCDNWLVISGADDRIVGSRAERFMNTTKKRCGGSTLSAGITGHVFADDRASTDLRMRSIHAFIKSHLG